MFRKILAAVLIMTAIAAASAAVPGLMENVELACASNNPACGNVERAPMIELACDASSGRDCNVQPVPAIELACNSSTGAGCHAVQIFRGGIA